MALIESRRYFQCGHCGAYHFTDTVEADGIRIVGYAQVAPKCPVCAVAMAHAILDDDHPIDFCARCRGVLMPRATFARVSSRRRAWATSPPGEPVPLRREDLQRELTCPHCSRRFETYPNYGPGNVVIDNCVTCDLIWLDFGEMRQIVDAPGRDRGSRRVPVVDEERVRKGPDPDDDDDDPPDRGRRHDGLGLLAWLLFDE